jgi:hypothetical protein
MVNLKDYFGSIAHQLRQMFPYSEPRDGRFRRTNDTLPLRNGNEKGVIHKQYTVLFMYIRLVMRFVVSTLSQKEGDCNKPTYLHSACRILLRNCGKSTDVPLCTAP